MSPMEIPYRLRHALTDKLGRYKKWQTAEEMILEDVWSGNGTPEELRKLLSGFPFSPDMETLKTFSERWKTQCLEEAEHLLKHEFTFFAFENFPFGKIIDWNCDYSTGKTIPQGYAPDIDYRNLQKVGDVKYLWEPARLQHLVRLAQAWRYSQDERFASEVVSQVSDFIHKNPFMKTVHWTSGIEVGLRLISLTWAFHLIRDYPKLSDVFCSLLIRSVEQHLAFIDRHYSAHSSANNHLVAEASGAYFAAAYWKNLKKSKYYQQRAKKRLTAEIVKQVFDDGVSKEQAFGYSFFVWDLWLIPALLGEAENDPFPSFYWERLQRMGMFLDTISDRAGNTPQVGDEDDGYAVILAPRNEKPVTAVRNLLKVIPFFTNTENTFQQDTSDEKTAWLYPSNFKFPVETPLVKYPKNQFFSFSEGGYHVLKYYTQDDHEILFVFDAGSLGYPSTAVHGHADALSLWLHINGNPILVDPGTFSYQDIPDRYYFRATSQHNTLSFENQNQAEYINRFIWGKKPKLRVFQSEWQSRHIVLDAEVTWFTGQRHRRRVDCDLNSLCFTITDQWHGDVYSSCFMKKHKRPNENAVLYHATHCIHTDYDIPPVIRYHFSPELSPSLTESCCMVSCSEFNVQLTNFDCECRLESYRHSPSCYRIEDGQRFACQTHNSLGEAKTVLQITLFRP
jgi:hypothetical protein